MASISGYDSSSISVLFSSLNNSGKSSGSGTSDLLGINYSDYATISNGSYFKLMKAYYTDGTTVGNSAPTSTSTASDSAATLSRIESATDSVSNAEAALKKTGTDSLFNKTQSTDEKGNTTYKYNTDAIYKAVNSFVDSYNSLLKEGGDSKTNNILSATKSMTTLTQANSSLLSSVGITVGSDNKLSIDETKFKSADMTTVKSLFNSTGGYGYQVSAQASMIKYYAQSEASKSNTYGSSGTYTYNYSSGTMYNTTT